MKILVSDFDGTIFDDNFNNNIEAIKRFIDRGNIFIIATGRNITSLKNEIEHLEIKYSYLICNDGGTIYDANDNLLAYKAIDPELVPKIYNFLDANRKATQEVFMDMGGEYSIDTSDRTITLISKIKDKEKCNELLSQLLTKYEGINGYLSKNWINIISSEVSKGKAIEYLANENNFDTNEIYTIGDDINDISMIKQFNGYVINHYDRLLDYSNKVVNSIEELINMLLDESHNN